MTRTITALGIALLATFAATVQSAEAKIEPRTAVNTTRVVNPKARIRLVDSLSKGGVAAQIRADPTGDGVFSIEIKKDQNRSDIVGAALRSLKLFSTAKVKFPTSNITVEIPTSALMGNATVEEKGRIESIVKKLKLTKQGEFIEVGG